MLKLTQIVAMGCRRGARFLAAPLGSLSARGFGPRARAVRRDLPGLLQAFNGRFADRCERADVEFTALAKSLRSLYQIAQALAGLVSERLGGVRTALHESRIAGSDGMAAASLQDLRDGLTEAAGELTVLRGVGEQLARLHSHVESIEQVGMSIRISVFGFAVESARTGQCQDTFGSFVAELRTLGDKITRVAEAIDRQAGTTRNAQAQEWQSLSASHAQLCQLAKQLESTASTTAADAQQMLEHVLRGLQQAEERMRQITRHAGEAVFYLQFGDIVRQKSEHIAAALCETTHELGLAASRRDFCVRALAADRVLAIQIGQLELVRTEVADARRKLAESFHSLAEASGELRETLGQWDARPTGPGNQSDSLAAFKADLLRMENLHRRGHELRLGARRSTQNAVEASHQLAGHVSEVKTLNSDIHLQALNAIVKTAPLGEDGAALSVLSMHVDSLYRESRKVVGDLVAVLESVIQETRASSGSQDLAEEAARNGRLQTGMENIESAFNERRATFTSANKLVEQQRVALDGSHALLGCLADYASAIESQIQELTAFRQMFAPWITGETPPVSPAESLNDRYTMQSERDIHDTTGRVVSTRAEAPGDEDVKLFETPQLDGQAASPPMPGSRNGSSEQRSAAVASAPVGASELGDNVELF